jgi:hypothetical protein
MTTTKRPTARILLFRKPVPRPVGKPKPTKADPQWKEPRTGAGPR